MTVQKSGNCGAGASGAKPEKPKMSLRFYSKAIFTLFSVAVLSFTAALIGGPHAAAQCNQPISTPSSKSVVYGFYAKGSGSGTRATIQWLANGVPLPDPQQPSPKDIDKTYWYQYTYSATIPSAGIMAGRTLGARITYIADAGSYSYISTTNFG